MHIKHLLAAAALAATMAAPVASATPDAATFERVDDQHVVVHFPDSGAVSALYYGTSPVFGTPGDQLEKIDDMQTTDEGLRVALLDRPGREYLLAIFEDGSEVVIGERRLPLAGEDNFRDIGGYITSDGRQVRWGAIYRSGELSSLTPADVAYLDSLDIETLCDFRTPPERQHQPHNIPAEWQSDPHCHGQRTIAEFAAELEAAIERAGGADKVDWKQFMTKSYSTLPLEYSDKYRAMFEDLLARNGTPLVFNCSAGKDRTGLAAALILLSVGVPEATVYEDFLLSNRFIKDNVTYTADSGIDSPWPAAMHKAPALAGVQRSYLESALDSIREHYGSVDNYLQTELGVDDAERERLRELLLVP